MNGYNLLRNWYSFKFANPSKVKASHSDFYCYLIDLWNRLGQKYEFGLPTSVTMETLGIGSYNTYKKVLNDLIDFGFIKIISESKNQHQSKVIALSKNDKATDKALDEATIKATDKAIDTITKQINNRTKEPFTYAQEIINANPNIPYEAIRENVNKILGTNHSIYNKNVQLQITELYAKGIKGDDVMRVIVNTKNDKWHKDKDYKSCPPSKMFTQEYFDRYNIEIEQPKEKFKIDPLTW